MRASKVYRGDRHENGTVSVTADGRELSTRDECGPTPFAWGRVCRGAEALALALLLDVTRDAGVAFANLADFTRQFVAQWDDAVWTVTGDEIEHWLSLSKTRAE